MRRAAVSNPTFVTSRPLNSTATAIIAAVYGMGATEAEPHALLRDAARSTTVIGKLLEGLADEYNGTGKKIAGGITTGGRIFWGLVEVSVPDSVLFYLVRNWIWILELLAVLIIGLGILAGAPAMWSIGIAMLVMVFILYQVRHAFHGYMFSGKLPLNALKLLAAGVVGFLIVVGAVYVCIHDGKVIADGLVHVENFFRWASGSHSSPMPCPALRSHCSH
jgi:hypothetical protein